MNNSANVRGVIQHEAYREVFPAVSLASDAQHHWKTEQGGVMYATGAGGTITGFGAGKHREGFGGAIIIDDPYKADEATSEVMRKNVIDWFQNTLESRKNSPDTPIIVIMQRLHEEDLSAGCWAIGGRMDRGQRSLAATGKYGITSAYLSGTTTERRFGRRSTARTTSRGWKRRHLTCSRGSTGKCPLRPPEGPLNRT